MRYKYMPPMLNFYNVGRSSCWPCSYMVPPRGGSGAGSLGGAQQLTGGG